MKKILVFQAYGSENIINENIFSILSLYRHQIPDQIGILVYTDRQDLFAKYFSQSKELSYVELLAEKLKLWRGQINFVHRVKIEVLLDAHKRYPQADLIYLDGDTYFLSEPWQLFSEISDSVSLMHVCENIIEEGRDPLSKKICKFLRRNHFQIGGKDFKIPTTITMCNAGVLGISAKNCKELLPQVLQFTDQAYAIYPKHVIEQLGFSYFLQTDGRKILEANYLIYHYWNQKEDYDRLIDGFLKQNSNITQATQSFSHLAWPQKPLKKKLGFKEFVGKIFRSNF